MGRPKPFTPLTARAAETAEPVCVVGIGASAGGLRALQQLFEAVPADSGLAFVVILHLDPERQSRMVELLQDRARIPVVEVSEPIAVEANHCYVIPPAHDLVLCGSTLELRDRGERSEHVPVDLFFRTLADARGARAVGVVLSGTGTDGTDGVRCIREAGGNAVVQSPEDAEYDGMPRSAIATGLVDAVLPAALIPAELDRLRRHSTTPSEALGGADREAVLSRIHATLRSRTGHDFSLYKESTVLRRLERRLRFNAVVTLEDYQALLESSATESAALLRDLLVSVSSFFRDPDAFEALALLIPGLFEGKGSADAVRVWVVGCATGEEVYSLGMLLAEHAATLSDAARIQVFATDVDEAGYGFARAGVYSAAAVANVSPERLRRFFTKEPGGYRIARELRELVLFAGHNALRDPPFSRMDLVSCRNVFIYLRAEAQTRLLETFHFALTPGGVLFLGASESIGDSGLFEPATATTNRLYRRSTSGVRATARPSAADPSPETKLPPSATEAGALPAGMPQRFSYGGLHVRLLEQYAPPSVVVDQHLDVVHMSAGAGDYLRLRDGQPSHNLLTLVSTDVRRALRTALHHAFGSETATTRRVRTVVGGAPRHVTIRVRPSADDITGRFALVTFAADEAQDAAQTPPAEHTVAADMTLEQELRRTRDVLEATIERHDSTVAELQLLNEELLSINEEQKAATQELETGREEIQSINEELTTINQEHQSTIEELKRTNTDLRNLIESTEIGTIFIDRETRIRRFTPAALALFNFVAADQGRPLSHITHRLNYPELLQDVASVLASLERLERSVTSESDQCFVVRISPYLSHEGVVEGAVLTFFDNSAQYAVERELRQAMIAAESANLAKGTFLSTLSHEFRTPLNAILGYADLLLLEGTLDDAQRTKVERITACSWHLTAMIAEILSFAKLDGGHEVVQSQPLDARLIAQEAGALMQHAAEARGLTFVLDVPAEPVRLVTDAGKARQILINLCGNAVKYTDVGEIRLRVHAEQERVVFEISDTGIGIAPEHLEHIFERFWQVDSRSTRGAGGLGIGLAAAREYARLLGGDIEVESVSGSGSIFFLSLPVATGAA